MANDVTRLVASQYESYVYPPPEDDLTPKAGEIVVNGSDPRVFQYVQAPGHGAKHCPKSYASSSQAAAPSPPRGYAYNHPTSEITGIDLSSASLAHEEMLKGKHGLRNLALHQLPIQDVGTLRKEFDLIDVTGVLHHIADPQVALTALRNQLHVDGIVSIMLYGSHARKGVYMLQEMFRHMGLAQDARSLEIVRQTLEAVPANHFVRDYLDGAFDIPYDAGLVDTFLHHHDKGYSVQDCLDLVRASGLVFQGWKENFYYYPEGQIGKHAALKEAVQKQDDETIWKIMELYFGQAAQHRFHACSDDRDPKTYRLDLKSDAFWDYIPVRRVDTVEDAKSPQLRIQRKPFPSITLQKSYAALFSQIDGNKSVRACMEAARLQMSAKQAEEKTREFLRSLWRIGYLFLRLP